MFFPDRHQSYTEVHRVLKPSGHYLFSLWDAWAENPFAEIVHNVVTEFFPDDPPGFYRVPFGYHDVALIQNEVTDSNFNEIDVQHSAITATIPSANDFAQGLIFGNPMFEEITLRGGDPDVVQSAVTEAIKYHLGDSMSLQALFAHAQKSK